MTTPNHIVLMPDGNGRWAVKNKIMLWDAYQKGYENLVDFCYWCKDRGVKNLTVFGFTSENWDRHEKIINLLLQLFEKKLIDSLEKYSKNNELNKIGVRIKIIGQKYRLPKSVQSAIEKIEEATKNNNKLFLNLAISYGGKWDILNAVKHIAKEGIDPEKINEKLFESHLATAGMPDPDFIIRTGGDIRLSNFSVWQAAYAELYFSPKLWPDFSEKDLDEALAEFSRRSRRFGK